MDNAMRNSIIENLNYANDPRVRARERAGESIPNFDKLTITFVGIDYRGGDDAEGKDLILPAKIIVCPTCGGRGSHVNPSIDCGGLTREEFDEDPDFAESYTSGAYDVPCFECNGRNVILEVNESRAKPADMAILSDYLKSESEDRATRMAEMRMGL